MVGEAELHGVIGGAGALVDVINALITGVEQAAGRIGNQAGGRPVDIAPVTQLRGACSHIGEASRPVAVNLPLQRQVPLLHDRHPQVRVHSGHADRRRRAADVRREGTIQSDQRYSVRNRVDERFGQGERPAGLQHVEVAVQPAGVHLEDAIAPPDDSTARAIQPVSKAEARREGDGRIHQRSGEAGAGRQFPLDGCRKRRINQAHRFLVGKDQRAVLRIEVVERALNLGARADAVETQSDVEGQPRQGLEVVLDIQAELVVALQANRKAGRIPRGRLRQAQYEVGESVSCEGSVETPTANA